jgi:hypothetical protein
VGGSCLPPLSRGLLIDDLTVAEHSSDIVACEPPSINLSLESKVTKEQGRYLFGRWRPSVAEASANVINVDAKQKLLTRVSPHEKCA